MRSWTVTPALSRALLVGVVLVGAAVLLGEPVLVVLAAPLVVLAALGLVHRPTSTPVVRGVLGHGSLYEGQGTRSRLLVTEAEGVEHVTRLSAQAPYVALHPASGRVSGLLAPRRSRPRDQPASVGATDPGGGEGRADEPLGRVTAGVPSSSAARR